MTMRNARRIVLVAAAAMAAASPISISANGLRVQEAACQDGTCCYEEKSTCVVGSHAETNYYYKPHSSCRPVQQ